MEVAGAGFLNFRLRVDAIQKALAGANRGEHLFFGRAEDPQTIVLDFSSPNVAKPMHVGHIRSTILGDCLARAHRLLGHRVITDNHIGDWGTQFGMLLFGWKTLLDKVALDRDPIAELERVYKAVNAKCDESRPDYDAATHETARAELVKLQGGDPGNIAIWREMIRLSQLQFDTIYGRLGVKFDHVLGESFYNSRLQAVVDELMARGIARESEGAKCVFSDGALPPKEDPFLIHRDGEWQPNPQLIQKRDGGFNYATTDLATLAYRLETWTPSEIIYVTDGRQQLHFQQVFSTFRRWHPERANTVKLVHVWFGSILGDNGKPLKTRSGENVKLAELLDEAEERAFKIVTEKSVNLPEPQRREIARVVGVGAVKYADLLPNRQTDYVFSWDKMLALNGNTAPYLQYAYARIQSILRKAGETSNLEHQTSNTQLEAPEELALARHLLNFGLVIEALAAEKRPNYLCNYLYELSSLFTRFYENCPVLKSEETTRTSRLTLCDLVARVIRQGLEILGIEVLDQM
ncbi:MAG: arginine--tRNA ligase [Verrucomicrobia bacterium]|nr:arginine--tRNA ligase [Verrucomicrobiota bacterium]